MFKESTPKDTRDKQLTLSTILVIFLAFNEYHFREEMFTHSLDFVQAAQAALNPDYFKYVFSLISSVSNPTVIIIVVIGLFILPTNKIFLTKLVIYIVSMAYTLSVIKSIYGNPRPYWVRPTMPGLPNYVAPGIIPLETYAEYGNPSAHLFFAMGLYGYLYNMYIAKMQREADARVQKKITPLSPLKEPLNPSGNREAGDSDSDSHNDHVVTVNPKGSKIYRSIFFY